MNAFVMQGIGKVGPMEKPIPSEVGPNDVKDGRYAEYFHVKAAGRNLVRIPECRA